MKQKFKEFMTESKNVYAVGDKVKVADPHEPMYGDSGVITKVKKIVFSRLYTVKFKNGKTNSYEYDELFPDR